MFVNIITLLHYFRIVEVIVTCLFVAPHVLTTKTGLMMIVPEEDHTNVIAIEATTVTVIMNVIGEELMYNFFVLQ